VKQIRQRLTYANVMSSIAVFFVLGGATAFAATKIGANELKANAVLTGKIKKEAITTSKVKNAAVNTSKLGASAVTSEKLAASAVTSEKLAPGSVIAGKLGVNAVAAGNLAPGAVGAGALSASTPGVALAGIKVINGKIESSFNRLGGTPTITETAAGVVEITIPGFTGVDGKVINSATLRGTAAGLINAVVEANKPTVRTWNIAPAGDITAADRGFNYVLFGTP
jgi:hypothetical protein